MVTAATARRCAIALPGVTEGEHQQHPDFRVGGRIFATLWNTGEHMVVIVSPLQALQWIRDEPQRFEANAWTRQGAVTIRLANITAARLKTLLQLAWRRLTSARPRVSGARGRAASSAGVPRSARARRRSG